MAMDLEAYRDFRLLTEIASDVSVTQRRLAKKFGLALGLTNFLIHRLTRKGYIKIVNLERKRLRYLLTPQGVAAKARLTYEYLEYSLQLYRAIRTFLAQVLSTIVQSGHQETVLVGTGEVAEIAFLILQQHRVNVIAVMEESSLDPSTSARDRALSEDPPRRRGASRVEGSLNGLSLFMNQPVRTLEELPRLSYDWIVIASFKDARQILQRLSQWGVPKERIIKVPDQAHEATAHPTPAEAMRDSLEAVMGARLI